MAGFDDLIDELERSYRDVQERMSAPAVYNDHREAADVGRRLKELEGPYRLAAEWGGAEGGLEGARGGAERRGLGGGRERGAALEAARGAAELRELVGDLERRLAELEEELRLALVERDPADSKDV